MAEAPSYPGSQPRSQFISNCRKGMAERLHRLERDVGQAAASTEKSNQALRLVAELTSLQLKIARLHRLEINSGLCPACYIDREANVVLQAEGEGGNEVLHCPRCNTVFSG
ncbi:MAG TPA: hypothetical protein VN667_11475 [Burkholderiales bacterium]|nr:hypothetical protein [Burkholderiales bacterium]